MKIAILSDIHSNLEALQACCRRADKLGVKRYICLGDIIGYGADPVATLELVMSLPGLIAVRGNHDEAVLSGTYAGVSKSVQEAIAWTHQQLLPGHLQFIRSLPYTQVLGGAVFAHASTQEPSKWEYLYNEEQIKKCMEVAERPLVFLGHTHLPKLYFEGKSAEVGELAHEEDSPIPLYQYRRYVINVGSVGQPRDGNSAASFVTFDNNTNEASFHRVIYDFNRSCQKILDADLAPHFAHRLKRRDWQ
ncbi:MAG: metallophosphoesterase family protein [Gammaproteobacteria bacterium]|nr:metallophosphoesterase family protein [Gammaproteobacteria bacterium]